MVFICLSLCPLDTENLLWSSLQLTISMEEGKDNTETLTQNLDKRLKGKKEKKEKDLQLNNLPV